MSNLDTFHLNVLLESTRLKTRKKFLYGSLVVAYVVLSVLSGLSWRKVLIQAALLMWVTVAIFGTVLGKSVLTQLSRYVPWTKFGYITLKIVGCEPFLEETSPNLFLHKGSAVGQIADWIKQKTQTKGTVELFWAGRSLDANKALPVGVVNGSSLIAILRQEFVDESLQLGQEKPRVVRPVDGKPTNPDFNFDPEEFSVPSFIRDMNDEEELESDTMSFTHRRQVPRENLSSLYNRIVNVLTQLMTDFGDTPWCHVQKSQMEELVVPPTPPPQPVHEDFDDESDSDTNDDEVPSFLREMHSMYDDDDDDDEDEPKKQGPSFLTTAVTFGSQQLRRLRRKFNRKRSEIWGKMTRFTRALKVADGTPRISKARDMITLDDDEDQVRFEMPCGGCGHSMSQSSLIEYMKNQVLVEKRHEISCPSHGCAKKEWGFGDLREILQQRHDKTFEYPQEDVCRIEKALSANFISKQVNCQRCPRCQVAVSRHPDTESYSMECFGCGWVYCWCCRTPWDTETDSCMNPKCTTAWRFVAAQMLKNCPRKNLDHMANVPTVRACPTCGQLITHVTACKHMRCSLCTTRFCFICMKPQKNGNWQCGYDANSCKLSEVQRLDSLADGRVVRTDILEQLPPEMFEKQAASNLDEFRKAQEEFVENVMAGVRSQTYFN